MLNPFSAGADRSGGAPQRAASGGRGSTSLGGSAGSNSALPLPPPGGDPGALQRLTESGQPIFCAGGAKPLVALTFDDGPGVNTQETIDLLRSREMTATFFTVGKLYDAAPGWPDLMREEARFGAVGDHTWDHVPVNDMSTSQLDQQILRTRSDAERITGYKVVLFRPPLALRSPTLDRYLPAHGMLDIMWSIDSQDSQGAKADKIYRTVRKHLSPGVIVLLHEGRGTTQQALPRILDLIQRRGYTTVTVPKLLEMDPPSARQLRTHTCPA